IPGTATIDRTLTVQGDPADSPNSLPQFPQAANFLTLAANGIVLNNLNLGEVTINLGQTGETISDSLVQAIGQGEGSGSTGSNRIFNNTISGSVTLGNPGNSGGSASDDQVVNNNFINPLIAASFMVVANNDTGVLIQSNNFTSPADLSAITVQDCTS